MRATGSNTELLGTSTLEEEVGGNARKMKTKEMKEGKYL
jgi:hypothetical protein